MCNTRKVAIFDYSNILNEDELQQAIKEYDCNLVITTDKDFFTESLKCEKINIHLSDIMQQIIKNNFLLKISLIIAVAEAHKITHLHIYCADSDILNITSNVTEYLESIKKLASIATLNKLKLEFNLLNSINPTSTSLKTLYTNHSKNKSLVLFSGGIDCTVAAAMLLKQKKQVHLLHIKYGQTNRREEEYCLNHIKEHLSSNINIHIIDISDFYKQISFSSALLSDTTKLTMENKELEYVPFRNTIFFAIALCICYEYNIGNIISGSQWDDSLSPDNSLAYYTQLQKVIKLQYKSSKIIIDPILKNIGGKPEIIKVGDLLGINYGYCWTCHEAAIWKNNIPYQCGVCSDCSTRYSAFQKVGLADPLPYNTTPTIRTTWAGKGKNLEKYLHELHINQDW